MSERKTSVDPFSSAGLDCTETFFLLFCVAFASWHLGEIVLADRKQEGETIKRRRQQGGC